MLQVYEEERRCGTRSVLREDGRAAFVTVSPRLERGLQSFTGPERPRRSWAHSVTFPQPRAPGGHRDRGPEGSRSVPGSAGPLPRGSPAPRAYWLRPSSALHIYPPCANRSAGAAASLAYAPRRWAQSSRRRSQRPRAGRGGRAPRAAPPQAAAGPGRTAPRGPPPAGSGAGEPAMAAPARYLLG